jgi:integrase
VKREWVARNIVALVDRPPPPRFKDGRIKFLTREEIEAVLRACPDDYLGAVERPLYLTAAMTGLRQGELIALRWCDVDWPASRVRVAESYVRGDFDSPKSHRGRSVLMADRLAGELERHFQATHWRAEDDLVFAHPLELGAQEPDVLTDVDTRQRFAPRRVIHPQRAHREHCCGLGCGD